MFYQIWTTSNKNIAFVFFHLVNMLMFFIGNFQKCTWVMFSTFLSTVCIVQIVYNKMGKNETISFKEKLYDSSSYPISLLPPPPGTYTVTKGRFKIQGSLNEQKEWFVMPNKISLMWDFKRLQQLYREDNYLVIIEIDCEKLWGIVVQL